jgi:Ala-tRNA(Pro) deacylase
MSVELSLLSALDAQNIGWTLQEHRAVFTVEESAELHETITGAHTKNMFLKDSGGQFWLVTVPHDIRVDLKALPAIVGGKKMSFGKAEDMERLLGVTPGAVTPLAAFNDSECEVKVVIDARLAQAAIVNVHPLRNTATIGLSGQQLVEFLTSLDHAPQILNVPTIG